MAIDPVCKMTVDEKTAKFKSEYKGKTYYSGQYYLDAFEMLGYLRIAYHITGDKKFLDHYQHLINEHQYLKKAAAWKMIT
jgi:YHS domain-containing protein